MGRCVPGVSDLQAMGDDVYEAALTIRLGPIHARFVGGGKARLDPGLSVVGIAVPQHRVLPPLGAVDVGPELGPFPQLDGDVAIYDQSLHCRSGVCGHPVSSSPPVVLVGGFWRSIRIRLGRFHEDADV